MRWRVVTDEHGHEVVHTTAPQGAFVPLLRALSFSFPTNRGMRATPALSVGPMERCSFFWAVMKRCVAVVGGDVVRFMQ